MTIVHICSLISFSSPGDWIALLSSFQNTNCHQSHSFSGKWDHCWAYPTDGNYFYDCKSLFTFLRVTIINKTRVKLLLVTSVWISRSFLIEVVRKKGQSALSSRAPSLNQTLVRVQITDKKEKSTVNTACQRPGFNFGPSSNLLGKLEQVTSFPWVLVPWFMKQDKSDRNIIFSPESNSK